MFVESAEYSPDHRNTDLENNALVKSGDSYLERAVLAEGQSGAIPSAILENASRFYEDVLLNTQDPEILARGALCLEGLAETDPESAEAQGLRAAAKAEIELGLKRIEEAGGDESHEISAPLLVVGAQIAAAEGDPEKAKEILSHLNGSAPSQVIRELRTEGVVHVGTVANALLGKSEA
jgi:hypothetical protein